MVVTTLKRDITPRLSLSYPLEGFYPMLSVYNGATDTEGVHVSMETVIQRILTGEKGLAEKTSHLNHLYQHDSDAYNREKVDLPAVTWSGMFPAGQSVTGSACDRNLRTAPSASHAPAPR